MQDYVDQATQIDTQFCPRDFAEAYYRNITAWADGYERRGRRNKIRDQPVAKKRQREAIGDRPDMEGGSGAGRALRRIRNGLPVSSGSPFRLSPKWPEKHRPITGHITRWSVLGLLLTGVF
jgi:hypothetical protein